MTEEEAINTIEGKTDKMHPKSNMSWAEVERRCSAYFEQQGIVYGMKAKHRLRKEKLGILPKL